MTDFYPITLGTGRMLKKAAPSSSAPPRPVNKTASSDKAALPPSAEKKSAARTLVLNGVKKDIFARDKHTCQCCGFKSEKYQQILFKDSNPDNLSPDNLLTTCVFCHQCFDITNAADMRSGALIWMPEIPQHILNNIAKALYISRISQGPVAELSRALLDQIMERRKEATKRITTDNPLILSTVLNDYLSAKAYSRRAKTLEGIRLFPLDRRIIKEAELEFNQFPQILAYWRSKAGPYQGKQANDWIEMYRQVI